MKKVITLGAVLAFSLLASTASAATISDAIFSNGDTTIDAQGNSTVSGTFTLQVGANEVCEVVRTQATPEPFTDTQVGGTLGYQQGTYTNVPFSVRVSPNTGTYYPTVQCAGIWGGNHSIDGADNVVATGNLGTIRVTANGSSSSTGVGSTDPLSSLTAMIAALVAKLTASTTPTAPVVSASCAAYAQANVGTMFGVKNDANVRLQGFLLSQGMSIPALAAGAAFGFDGQQTEAARATFVNANHCI